jgi:hypothetical protein
MDGAAEVAVPGQERPNPMRSYRLSVAAPVTILGTRETGGRNRSKRREQCVIS